MTELEFTSPRPGTWISPQGYRITLNDTGNTYSAYHGDGFDRVVLGKRYRRVKTAWAAAQKHFNERGERHVTRKD